MNEEMMQEGLPEDPDKATESSESSYLDFPMPEGLELPKGTEDGGEVDLLATFQLKGDKLCLKAVEGMPIEGQAEAPVADDVSYADAVEKGL